MVSALVVMAAGAMFVSCNGNNPTNGCVCTTSLPDGSKNTVQVTLAQMQEIGATTCQQVADIASENHGPYSCKAY